MLAFNVAQLSLSGYNVTTFCEKVEIMAHPNMKITHEQLREELKAGSTTRQISERYGISERNVRIRIAKLKATGFDPENHRYYHNPENHPVKGYSTLSRFPEDDPLGRVLEWTKTNVALTDQLQAIERLIESLALEIEPVKSVKYGGVSRPSKEHVTVIPLGDPHVGLMTWAKEVGHDWDLKIAMRVYRKIFTRLLEECRDTEECILINTGDFFHADNIDGVTSRSRHKLDMDGRHGKWLDVGGALLCMFIDFCLKKFKRVTFINVPGNHDDILGRFLGTLAELAYRNEKRLTVMKGDAPRQYVQRGLVAIGAAHSHLCKLKQLPQSMAMDVPQMWGATKLRIFFTGHVHHESETIFKDNNGVMVCTAGIVPPADAYAHGAGYGSYRTIQAATLDIVRGEVTNRPMATVRATD